MTCDGKDSEREKTCPLSVDGGEKTGKKTCDGKDSEREKTCPLSVDSGEKTGKRPTEQKGYRKHAYKGCYSTLLCQNDGFVPIKAEGIQIHHVSGDHWGHIN